MSIKKFQNFILDWYKENKRDYLPWRNTRDPYKILVSEIMLQQTQVSRVLQKYPEFLKAFPTIQPLANAPLRKVLAVWQGMGYNRRALYLKRIAKEVVKTYGGRIPTDPKELQKLPGIGRYTAGAVACFAFNKPVVFLDTNIRKVYLYNLLCLRSTAAMRQSHDREESDTKVDDREILEIAEKALYKENPRIWHYALMDYGALMLGGEKGILEKAKAYHKQSPFLGSTRYFRSKIVRHLLGKRRISENQLRRYLQRDAFFSSKISIATLLSELQKEQIVKQDDTGYYSIS